MPETVAPASDNPRLLGVVCVEYIPEDRQSNRRRKDYRLLTATVTGFGIVGVGV